MEKERNHTVDILKLFSLFHMIFDHIYVTLYDTSKNNFFTIFLYEIIPLCPATFLFFAGYSLAINDNYNNISKRIKFAILYIVTSQIFFLFEHEIQFPHFPFSTGILNTIGIFIIISVLILNFLNFKFYYVFTTIIIVLFIILDFFEIKIFPLTYGYEPYFPTILFGFLGFLYYKIENNKKINTVLLFISILIFILLNLKYGFFKPLYTDYGREILNFEFRNKNSTYVATIWNFNNLSFLFSYAFIIVIYNTIKYLKIKIPNSILLPTKYLYFSYIFHLAIIGILFVFFNISQIDNGTFFIIYMSIILSLYQMLNLFENFKKLFRTTNTDKKGAIF